ncbi:major type 1 subunit fimbrin (pilin) [Serratia fonticola]|jgi:major type 1 subunit fimbrin (pilin)|uniref:Major type 1 subunit fimbrin (Pilin) n=1 Tax=Serratia fonticola TaxID=47917 RepID=A0A559T435_SERFO|nr:fimbrial protein [Serratia fonticola]TQI78141.1 major type 1 subunit fimbrin (pilin) [Serratia fonticola]TQI94861.1 major type 1 subunit fimbrin (pilin) [Serratia fonticola]TVZ69359.1 major type 1 subunit fimbrin (pilin) [Serratia fonticola]
MIRKILFIVYCVFWVNMAWSYDTFINVSGNIMASGCTLDSESELIKVDMHEVNRTQFSMSEIKTPEVPFKIQLRDCAASVTGATVTFSGQLDADNNQLLGISSGDAKGVAIKLMDEDKTIIPMNVSSKNFPITGGNDAELQFYAQYVPTGRLVTPGDANAIATYTVSFP